MKALGTDFEYLFDFSFQPRNFNFSSLEQLCSHHGAKGVRGKISQGTYSDNVIQ